VWDDDPWSPEELEPWPEELAGPEYRMYRDKLQTQTCPLCGGRGVLDAFSDSD
jgi:hypothetical protein